MITLITGIPGMGKTSFLVSKLLEYEKAGERPLFIMGIPDLTIEHNPAPPIEEWTELRADVNDPSLKLPYYTFPPNSILVIDEAQRVFRARASGSKVPDIVAALETHRHTGLDIILLTQKPLLIDVNVRELVQRHYHIRPTILGRTLYEFPEFTDVKNKQDLADASKKQFRPPKEAFKYYTSTVQVTKNPMFVHKVWYLLAFLVLVIGFFSYKLYNGLYKRVTGQTPVLVSDASASELLDIPKELKPVNHPPSEKKSEIKKEIPHPYMGFNFYIKAVVTSSKFNRTYFELRNGSNVVQTTSVELEKLGYKINQPNDCASFLFFNGAQVVATCELGADTTQARQRVGGGGDINQTDDIVTVQPYDIVKTPGKGSPASVF